MDTKKSNLWEEKEVLELIRLYPNTKNDRIAEILNKSIKSVETKGFRLGLNKSKEYKSKWVAKRNKKVGRDLTIERLTEIAKGFKSRSDFQVNDSSVYQSARRLGILDEICSHMSKRSFSKPQMILRNILDELFKSKSLYNDRKIIKPYEIDIFYPEFNLVIEYQGRYWHKFEHNGNDSIKEKIFKERGLNVIYFYEKSRDYEKEIKEEIIEKLPIICELTGFNISEEDVKNVMVGKIEYIIYNKEEALRVAKTYTTHKEFKEKEPHSFKCLSKMGYIKEGTKHMCDVRNHFRTIEEMKEIISKYTNLGDFIENEKGTYLYIKRNKEFEYLLNKLNKKVIRHNFNIDEIKNLVSKYEKKCDFIKENKPLYIFIKKKGLTSLLIDLKKCR